ncbi:MAG TPA: ABC transporter permease [Vicinamibacteria bacterium]|nr:ABC transporter permease [Vicinamibacteria bacterium]
MKSRWRHRLERIGGMVGKEFRQIFRDPRMARVIVVAPVIQLLVFGYAVSTDVDEIATFLVDHDRSRESRELVEALTASGAFEVVGRSDRSGDLVLALDRGDAAVGLEIPAGFSTALRTGSGARVQILLDGTSSNTASVAQSYAERIVQEFALGRTVPVSSAAIDFRERPWFNPNLESRDYNVPAVVGALILLVCLLLTSLAVVREREIGTLEQLNVTPLTPGELIAGKTIPFAVIGLVDLSLVTAVSILWFEVPFRGSAVHLLAASILYLLSGLGLGLLISTVSSTQQEAFMASFLIFQPAILLSGFMFPVTSMPEIFQWVTLLNPVRHYIEVVRAVFLKGPSIEALWTQYTALLLIGGTLLWIASRRFQKTAR